MVNTLAASPAALEVPHWGRPLAAEELDETVGGMPEPISLAVMVFAVSVVVGIIDRILFGGCRCR